MENKKISNEEKIKAKITDYVNRVELLLEEMKSKSKEAEEQVNLAKKSESDVQNNHLLNHFIITNYSALIWQDLTKTVDRLVECYSNSVDLGFNLKLSDNEQKIIDNYIKQVAFVFHIDKGKVIPKQDNLLELMKSKAETLRHETFLEQYKKQILN